MRQIGTLSDEAQAQRFSQYLLSQKIESRLEANHDQIEIWVYDENHLNEARAALRLFQADPNAEMFVAASKKALKIRAEQERRADAAIRRYVDAKQRRETPPSMQPTITLMLILFSVIITIATSLDENPYGLITELSITSYRPVDLDFIRYAPSLPEIRSGEVWRLITPIFTHFGPLHLVFNMIITYQFGVLLEHYLKWWRFLLLVLTIAVTSNLTQFYLSGPTFGGMSGVDFGLFGFLWMKSTYEPESGLSLRPDFVYFMLGFLVLCFTGIFGPVANGAHVMGLVTGAVIALVHPAWKTLRRARRGR